MNVWQKIVTYVLTGLQAAVEAKIEFWDTGRTSLYPIERPHKNRTPA